MLPKGHLQADSKLNKMHSYFKLLTASKLGFSRFSNVKKLILCYAVKILKTMPDPFSRNWPTEYVL